MSLISKTTSCFKCGKTDFPAVRIIEGPTGYEMVKEHCAHCGSFKTTVIGTKWGSGIAGNVDYHMGKRI